MANSPKHLLFDTDVLINWLTQEATAEQMLWKAPLALLELSETGAVTGLVSLTSVLELRAVLRRKKGLSELTLRHHLDRLTRIVRIRVPSELSLLRADRLQASHHLDAFDAILLAIALEEDAALISRDGSLLKIAARFLNALTPELALSHLKR